MNASSPVQAAIAAHRFGLGEADLGVVGGDARGWLSAQIGAADPARGDGLLDTRQALAHVAAEREARQLAKNPPPGMTAQQILGAITTAMCIAADVRSRLLTAAMTTPTLRRTAAVLLDQPLHRLAAEGQHARPDRRLRARRHPAEHRRPLRDPARGLDHPSGDAALSRQFPVGGAALARRPARGPTAARRPRCGSGRRLGAIVGPRVTGINENLAREVLELHTLGAESARQGVYTQADVTSFAAVLTGWRVAGDPVSSDSLFNGNWHEPGPKTVLGKTYPEGPDALRQFLRDLARHPATARFIATKLARHFVADEPPPALVDSLPRST